MARTALLQEDTDPAPAAA